MGSKQEVSRRATISVDTLRVGDTLHSQALGTQPVADIRSTTYEVFVEFADGSAIVYRHGADVEIEIDRNITGAYRDQEPKAEPDETDAASYVEAKRFTVDDRPSKSLRYAVVAIRGAGEIYEHPAVAAFTYYSDARKFADELNGRVVPEPGE